MFYREIMAVCSEIHTKHINTLCGQNVELLNVKPVGTYSDHWVFSVYIKLNLFVLFAVRPVSLTLTDSWPLTGTSQIYVPNHPSLIHRPVARMRFVTVTIAFSDQSYYYYRQSDNQRTDTYKILVPTLLTSSCYEWCLSDCWIDTACWYKVT